MSSQDSKPLLSLKQDSMTGGYKLTYGRVKIPKHVFFDCMTSEYLVLKDITQKLEHIVKVYKWTGLYDIEKKNLEKEIIKQTSHIQSQILDLTSKKDLIKETFKSLPADLKKSKKEEFNLLKDQIATLKLEVDQIADQIVYDEIIFNGHSLFSMLLPNDFEYSCKNGLSPDKKDIVVIRGVLLSGTLSKVAIGSSSGSLIHYISKDYGYQVACDFVTNYQILICDWLIHYGFTISLKDCIPKNTDVVEEEMNKCFLESISVMKNEKDDDIFEGRITNILNKATSIGQKLSKQALDDDNNIVSVVISGAKGNDFNITQITGAVGQQNISGERIQKHYGGRTLPHYKKTSHLTKYCDRIDEKLLRDETVDPIPHLRKMFESRGFVSHSYFQGLNPQEFFFHCAGGREGLIDTAVKTSVTGYTQRRMIKMVEDLRFGYSNVVTNANDTVIQFMYGEDNFDASKLIKTSNGLSFCDIKHIAEKFNNDLEFNDVVERL